jgi:hypothetical protein
MVTCVPVLQVLTAALVTSIEVGIELLPPYHNIQGKYISEHSLHN